MMYFPSSGRKGFAHFRDNQPLSKRGTKQELIEMLQKENELRLSEEWIQKMEDEINEMKMDSPLAGYSFEKRSPVIAALQTEVAKSFGYTTSSEIKEAMRRIHTALATYPNDKTIKNAANYLKYNRIEEGDFKQNQVMATHNIQLLPLSVSRSEDEKQQNAKWTPVALDDVLNKRNKQLNVLMAISVT
eukprot:220398_1